MVKQTYKVWKFGKPLENKSQQTNVCKPVKNIEPQLWEIDNYVDSIIYNLW